MNLYRPRLATKSDLCTFHSQEYIDFLSRVTTDNMSSYTRELEKFSVGLANGDTPLFGGKFFLPQTQPKRPNPTRYKLQDVPQNGPKVL